MESPALFVTCQDLGIKAGAVCGVVAKRTEGEGIVPKEKYDQALQYQIAIVRGAVERLEKVESI